MVFDCEREYEHEDEYEHRFAEHEHEHENRRATQRIPELVNQHERVWFEFDDSFRSS